MIGIGFWENCCLRFCPGVDALFAKSYWIVFDPNLYCVYHSYAYSMRCLVSWFYVRCDKLKRYKLKSLDYVECYGTLCHTVFVRVKTTKPKRNGVNFKPPVYASVPKCKLEYDGLVVTWLILPVVICLSQRLSHACLSTNHFMVKPRMAH